MVFWKKPKKANELGAGDNKPKASPVASTNVITLSEVTEVPSSRPVSVPSGAKTGLKTPEDPRDYLLRSLRKARCALSSGTRIQGRLTFDSPVQIDGYLSGELYSTDVLVVGRKGVVEGDIKARSVVVLGKVMGNIFAQEIIELGDESEVVGDIQARSIKIAEGAVFNGGFSVTKLRSKLESPKINSDTFAEPPSSEARVS